ncbi:hypothetical protein BHE74_00010242 [Ensete ventricosum]|nr:hypothetical protein GW17_00047647 [Ensete ventricosum]RWW81380.1 hypothetical protein BHE74_00010242 [Ensete ventricosum]
MHAPTPCQPKRASGNDGDDEQVGKLMPCTPWSSVAEIPLISSIRCRPCGFSRGGVCAFSFELCQKGTVRTFEARSRIGSGSVSARLSLDRVRVPVRFCSRTRDSALRTTTRRLRVCCRVPDSLTARAQRTRPLRGNRERAGSPSSSFGDLTARSKVESALPAYFPPLDQHQDSGSISLAPIDLMRDGVRCHPLELCVTCLLPVIEEELYKRRSDPPRPRFTVVHLMLPLPTATSLATRAIGGG